MIAVALTGLTAVLSPFTFLAGLLSSTTGLVSSVPAVGSLVTSLLNVISGL